MRESDLLHAIFTRTSARGPGVLVGPGDDCAVLAWPGSRNSAAPLLVTVDHLVERRHYTPGTAMDLIARKAVARSVSDIAAMAGTPRFTLATAALPDGFPQADAERLVDRLASWAEKWSCPLVGGDTSTLPRGSPSVLTVTVIGEAHTVRGAVLRSGARPGDGVYITGAVGGSFASGRHLTFEPRHREGLWLADTLGERLTAMLDVSDGLGRDAGRIASASKVRIRLHEAQVPVHADAGARPLLPRASVPPGTAVHPFAQGEDYELLFTAAGDVPRTCPATGTPITRIGDVIAGSGCVAVDASGVECDIARLGWDHGEANDQP